MTLYIKLMHEGLAFCKIIPIVEVSGFIEAELADAEPGDAIHLEVVEMTAEDFEALPEFEGW